MFRRLWDFLTGDDATAPQLDELDTVFIPSDDVFDGWLATLSEADKRQLAVVGREIHDAGQDYMRFLAITHHLHVTRSGPVQSHIRTARQRVAPLLARFEGIAENEWTEAELDQWLDSLDDFWRSSMYDRVRSYTNRGGTDIPKLLCALRHDYEANLRLEDEATPGIWSTLLSLWYIWMEESRKHEQHHAARELRQYLREQRSN